MVKIEVEIPQTEYSIITKAAENLRLKPETLIQQEVDHAVATISVWAERLS